MYLLTLLGNVSKDANRMDLDKTAPSCRQSGLGLHCLSETSKIFKRSKQTTLVVIGLFYLFALFTDKFCK